MKIRYISLLVLPLIIASCCCTISTAKKAYTITETKPLKSNWKFNSKEWLLKKDTLIGTGGPMHWGVIESKKQLPEIMKSILK